MLTREHVLTTKKHRGRGDLRLGSEPLLVSLLRYWTFIPLVGRVGRGGMKIDPRLPDDRACLYRVSPRLMCVRFRAGSRVLCTVPHHNAFLPGKMLIVLHSDRERQTHSHKNEDYLRYGRTAVDRW